MVMWLAILKINKIQRINKDTIKLTSGAKSKKYTPIVIIIFLPLNARLKLFCKNIVVHIKK